MNQQYQDHLNFFITDRRYVINEIDKYRVILLQLEGDSRCPIIRILKYVIQNYILPELEDDLQVIHLKLFIQCYFFEYFLLSSSLGDTRGNSIYRQ